MDYTKQSFLQKLLKASRYARMYGPSRAAIKARGAYHMKANYDVLPECEAPATTDKHVGIIGCGNFPFTNIAFFLRKNKGNVLRGVMDIDAHRAASFAKYYKADYYTCDADKLLQDPAIDLIYVASNHSTHTDYAIRAIEAGKAVHVEKPHVVDTEQMDRLEAALKQHNGRLRIGFNRPHGSFGKRILSAMENESGSAMINWFVVGHKIDDKHWYYDPKEKGRVLGNLCHWTDCSLRMVAPERRYPIRIIPARAERADCDIAVTFVFGDGSIATLAFSAKGATYEGVRESLAAQKGNTMISMRDFDELIIDEHDSKRRFRPLFRQHGHEDSIMASYGMSRRGGDQPGEDLDYIRQTAELFLATREALETDRELLLAADGTLTGPEHAARAGAANAQAGPESSAAS